MGSPLRILHVVVNMNRGGAETLIMNLYRNIDRTKVQFDFLTCKPGVFDSEIMEMGGKVHRIPYLTDVGHLKYVEALKNFFTSNNQYKIVHSHMDKMSGLVLREAKRAGIPTRISHSHNTSSEGGIASKVYKWYAGNFILHSATNLLACSSGAAEWLFKRKSAETKIVKNGIVSELFDYSEEVRKEVRDELNISNDEYILGHVGRFNLQKNHNFLIEVFAKLNKKVNHSTLLLIGDGPLRTSMEKKAKELQVSDKVKFLGIRSDIHRILQSLDVFVFPSLHEGLPVSLVEAQGAGLPCIISDGISREVDLGGDLIDFLSLSEQDEWIRKLMDLQSKKFYRQSYSTLISNKGYDIRESAEYMEIFYLGLSG
ncbi:glycosyltransferase family 1 protein [Neobacillus sp. LXY-1]|uniref:glycosyltransferase family 1 protein n=1 Tax=Neobacillus sp. LXY-1 TaxID=3379133 RepID=UPI003EDEAE02